MKPIDEDIVSMSMAHLNGDVETVRKLMESRPELRDLAPGGDVWLYRAASNGHIGLVDYWLGLGFDVNHNTPGNSKRDGVTTPLHFAKTAELTRHLISQGAKLNEWGRYNGTALHCAVVRAVEVSQRGRPRTTSESVGDQIRVLLEAGADPSIANFDGLTPLALAIKLKRKTAEMALRQAGAPERGSKPLGLNVKAPKVDLRKDATRIVKGVENAMKKVTREKIERPLTGLFLAVSGIEGYVIVSFDTNGADNAWDASLSEYATMEFGKWRDLYEMTVDHKLLICFDGTKFDFSCPLEDEAFEKPFLDVCVGVLKQMKSQGLFDHPPFLTMTIFGIEATLGGHGENV